VLARIKITCLALIILSIIPIYTLITEGSEGNSILQVARTWMNIVVCVWAIFTSEVLGLKFFVKIIGVQITLVHGIIVILEASDALPISENLLGSTENVLENFHMMIVVITCQLLFSTEFFFNALLSQIIFLVAQAYLLFVVHPSEGERTPEKDALTRILFAKVLYVSIVVTVSHYGAHNAHLEMFLKNRVNEHQN